MKCKYDLAWIGKCPKDSVENEEYCAEHLSVLCTCGEKAVGQCYETGFLVCGRPTCDKSFLCHNHLKKREEWHANNN